MIPVPFGPKEMRERNSRKGQASSAERCLICWAPVNMKKAYFVRVHCGGDIIVTEAEASGLNAGTLLYRDEKIDEGWDLGNQPIGPDCWRSHPELKPYGEKS